jgi:hypothetical protein
VHAITKFVGVLVLGLASSHAHADTKSYCERFAKDIANGNSSDVDSWLAHYRRSLDDCITPKAAEAEPVVPIKKTAKGATARTGKETIGSSKSKASQKTIVMPAKMPRLVFKEHDTPLVTPEPHDWSKNCSERYNSFSRDGDYYVSKSGKRRRCIDMLNQ